MGEYFYFRDRAFSVFMYGSKTEINTWSRIFFDDQDISGSPNLFNLAKQISQFSYCTMTIDIYFDGFGAIKALSGIQGICRRNRQ